MSKQNNTQTRLFYTNEQSKNYIFWRLTGMQPSSWWMLIQEDESSIQINCFLDSRYAAKQLSTDMAEIQQKLKTTKHVMLEKRIFSKSPLDEIKKQSWTHCIVEKSIPYGLYDHLKEQWFELSFDEDQWQAQRRMIKTPAEQRFITKAINLTNEIRSIIEDMIDWWTLLWMSEQELRWVLLGHAYQIWATNESFDMIVATWANSAVPHHSSSDARIEPWPLLIDMWFILNWYCSDMTRTYWVGPRDSLSSAWVSYDEFSTTLKAVQEAHTLWCTLSLSGTVIWSLSKAVREQLWDLNKYFTHSLGHWLGVEVHEQPRIGQQSKQTLESWMVITIEPWVYFDGKYWIRREDTIVVA